jgi:hypothetical protein
MFESSQNYATALLVGADNDPTLAVQMAFEAARKYEQVPAAFFSEVVYWILKQRDKLK